MIAKTIHTQILEGIASDIEKLEFQLSELHAVQRYHMKKAAEEANDDSVKQFDKVLANPPYKGKTRHEAAEMVICKAGSPMSVADIVEELSLIHI